MSCRISKTFGLIVGAGNNFIVANDDGANRYLFFFFSQTCFSQSLFHKVFVFKRIHLRISFSSNKVG